MSAAPATTGDHGHGHGPRQGLAALALGALGVVYGDIGTSPLYTMREVLNPANGVTLQATDIVGAVSAIFWALMLVVTLKYVVLILRADNKGEGGIMALTALAVRAAGSTAAKRRVLLLVGVCGASLFYGDSVITPAISVMGAVEGLEIVTPAFKPFVLPISIAVLTALFFIQRHGSAAVGVLFGPVMLVWFAVLGLAGIHQIVQAPEVLAALNPLHALNFLFARGPALFLVVGALVLALTGAEALYADMGHFGKRPIRLAWTVLVLPTLALNYAGQGALLMRDPSALDNPFFRLFPPALLLPVVLLATLASVIASQAVISGAFSLTKEAIQLGLLPRMRVVYTSAQAMGQVYLPAINWTLLVAVLLAVLGFESSSALASAYGIAVTITMLITTALTFFVVRHAWRYPAPLAWGVTAGFLAVDALLVASCSLKVLQGGWFPLVMGLVLFAVMATWRRGKELLAAQVAGDDLPLVPFLEALAQDVSSPRPERIAVYPVSNPDVVPPALLHNLKHYQMLHARNVLVTVRFEEVPYMPEDQQLSVEPLPGGFWRVVIRYGFKDEPNIPAALGRCARHDLQFDPFLASYFLSREVVVPASRKSAAGLAPWRSKLFATMARNGSSAADYFRLPDNAVIELGSRVQL
ncbi:potassium transporter Kup [Roseateles chitosanitabidus]|uniref:potassium transporter Kup n=1 Tax=Roseateles chitosanitabidus TaxID=65048 RepID=UPI00082FA07A|nr:potassium transporter Kup [Roseateles chitosanitabidus]MBO9686068.1 potassium transporter Kup [Roseateles chitosanitabidus]